MVSLDANTVGRRKAHASLRLFTHSGFDVSTTQNVDFTPPLTEAFTAVLFEDIAACVFDT